jgi:hypothetical protein
VEDRLSEYIRTTVIDGSTKYEIVKPNEAGAVIRPMDIEINLVKMVTKQICTAFGKEGIHRTKLTVRHLGFHRRH